ncbi:MAG: YidB family protein [Xanthomonadales bacterium]|nr:YidB family protein [Xanthomonadales bacterium]
MDLMKLGTELFGESMKNVDQDALGSALGDLLSGSDGKLDLGGIVSSMNDSGLGDIAASWLGDGSNSSISIDQIQELLGSDKIAQIASQLNTGEGSLLESLSTMLPQLIDKSSSGGSFLDSLGGTDGLMDMAGKFFK